MPSKPSFTVAQVEGAIRKASGILLPAAQILGCDRSTIYTYIKKYPTLQAVLVECREGMVDRAEFKLMEAIDQREPWAVSLMLKTLGKNRGYVERQEVDHAVDGMRSNVHISLPPKTPYQQLSGKPAPRRVKGTSKKIVRKK